MRDYSVRPCAALMLWALSCPARARDNRLPTSPTASIANFCRTLLDQGAGVVRRLGGHPDYYENREHRPEPKKNIGTYVARNGFKVPAIYANLGEAIAALKKGTIKQIILRSEWPDEYDGYSGLVDSYPVTLAQLEAFAKEEKLSLDSPEVEGRLTTALKKVDLARLKAKIAKLGPLAQKINLDFERLSRELTYSVWEMKEGRNITVAQDSGNPKLFHVVSQFNRLTNHFIFDDQGKLVSTYGYPEGDDLAGAGKILVDTYSRIKSLPRFDSDHAPITEFQLADDGPYFLQYHRGQDIALADFKLDQAPGPGFAKATFVRGITPKEGIVLDAPVITTGKATTFFGATANTLEESPNPVAQEAFARDADAKVYITMNDVKTHSPVAMAESGHEGISGVFKPGVSVTVDRRALIPPNVMDQYYAAFLNDMHMRSVKVLLISDGTNAYVKYLGPSDSNPRGN